MCGWVWLAGECVCVVWFVCVKGGECVYGLSVWFVWAQLCVNVSVWLA